MNLKNNSQPELTAATGKLEDFIICIPSFKVASNSCTVSAKRGMN